MTACLRAAVRRFGPFESVLPRQFADFIRAGNVDACLELEPLDLNPLHDRLFAEAGLADGSLDMALLCTDWLAQAQATSGLRDLTPFLAAAPIPDFPEGWTPSLLNLQRFHGGVWGMPYHDGPECLIYRADLLEAASISVPTTWAELHEAARRLHAPDQGRYGTVLALYPDGHNGFYDFCIHVWSRGGEPFAEDGRPLFTTPQAVAALDFMRALAADVGAVAPEASRLDSVKAGLLFCEGRIALMTSWFGFAALGETAQWSRVRGRVDVAAVPRGEGGRSVSLNVFWVIGIAAGSANAELCWSFLRHLATAPMDKLTTLEGAIGVRRSTWADPDVNRIIPYYHKLGSLHEHARELPLHPQLAQISHIVDELLGKAITSNVPSALLLQDAQGRADGLLI